PGLFNDVRETVARASIVNPDLVPPAAAGGGAARSMLVLPRQPLAAAVREALEKAPSASRSEGAFVNSAVVFGDSGEAETYLWVFTTRASKRPFFHALVRDSQGRDVATVTEPA